MNLRSYELTPNVLAWHEAGHVTIIEAVGEHWVECSIDLDTMSGCVITNESQMSRPNTAFNRNDVPKAVIGTSPELKLQSIRIAIQYFAGLAAERVYLGLPFDSQVFSDEEFHDFAFARWILSLTDSESDADYCARIAYDLVVSNRRKIERMAIRLRESGKIHSLKVAYEH